MIYGKKIPFEMFKNIVRDGQDAARDGQNAARDGQNTLRGDKNGVV